jgi:hypothetical protein
MFRFTIRDVLWVTAGVAGAAALAHYAGPRGTPQMFVGLSVLTSVAGIAAGWSPVGKRLTAMACAFGVIGLIALAFSN